MSRWGPYVRRRLDDLEAGKGREDWEGQWPSSVAVRSAWRWACEVIPENCPAPSVVPGGDGEVLFIWHRLHWDVEIETDRESTAIAWAHHRTLNIELSGNLDDPELRARVTELLGTFI